MKYNEMFEYADRVDGKEFVRIKDGVEKSIAESLRQLVRVCQSNFESEPIFPSDWVYKMVYLALEEYEEGHRDIDSDEIHLEPDYRDYGLIEWLYQEPTIALSAIEEAKGYFGFDDDFTITKMIAYGQVFAMERIWSDVREWLKESEE